MTPGQVARSLRACIAGLDRSGLDAGGRMARDDIRDLARRIDAEGIRAEDDGEDDDGFVVLPIGRFDGLRRAEEDLRGVRAATTASAAPLRPYVDGHLSDLQGEVLRIKDRMEGFDLRLKSFGARLVQVEEALRRGPERPGRDHGPDLGRDVRAVTP